VSIGAVNEKVANKIGGLLEVARKLSKEFRNGWGVRDTIIGSARDYKIGKDEWDKIVELLSLHIQKMTYIVDDNNFGIDKLL